ncbi:MAG: aminotransferase class I/II-fold pyridoxal phosphate-dependent enzyme [Merdibacter sp.]|nr:aminotransferase class I/II-fold pyridoxal phosphate-dependent enzyme [Merdibacter sp.]
MRFVKEQVDLNPIVDTVFAIVSKAKEAKKELGEDKVVDATIGSLYNEEGKIVAFDSVFNTLKQLPNEVMAAYAGSFTGNPNYREHVYDWVVGDRSSLAHSVIATPGGTGAVSITVSEMLDEGETLIIPEICWGSYSLMASMDNLKTKSYTLFEGDHFNVASFKAVCEEVMKEQKKVVAIINDPCHNPTGYSLSAQEWDEVIQVLNELSTQGPVVLLNDIAYIDFAYRGKAARDYIRTFDKIGDNVFVVIAFSISKSLTAYGMRCGAAILMAQKKESVREVEIVFEKAARATWSNVNNSAMENFVAVTSDNKENYEAEKDTYVKLLKERSGIFTAEADACGLQYYPYKEGFFVTLKMDNNEIRDLYHDSLMNEHIYTVKVNKGIRVAVCSLPVEKCYGLAGRMKDILDSVKK